MFSMFDVIAISVYFTGCFTLRVCTADHYCKSSGRIITIDSQSTRQSMSLYTLTSRLL